MREDHYVMMKRSNGIWYYYVYRWGKKVYRSTGERKKFLAQEVINDRLRENDLLCEKELTRPKTFEEFATGFWDYDRCPIVQDKIQRGGHYSRQSASTYAVRTKNEYIPFLIPFVYMYVSKTSALARFKSFLIRKICS